VSDSKSIDHELAVIENNSSLEKYTDRSCSLSSSKPRPPPPPPESSSPDPETDIYQDALDESPVHSPAEYGLGLDVPLKSMQAVERHASNKTNATSQSSYSSDSLLQTKDKERSAVSSSSSLASAELINELIRNHPRRTVPSLPLTTKSDPSLGSKYVTRLRESASIHEQLAPETTLSPSPSDEDQARIRKKFNLIRELTDTEQVFATDMGVLVDIYYRKLRTGQYFGYLCRSDLLRLFSNVDHILQLSRQFVMTLKDNISPYVFDSETQLKDKLLVDANTKVGSAFLDYIPIMDQAFQTYCDSNKWQMDTFYRLRVMACPGIDSWLTDCLEESKTITTAWTLDALLIKPVQRLLKYPLLLDSMLKTTPEDHPDFAILSQAAARMRECVKRINADQPTPQGSSPSSRSGAGRREEPESLRQLKTDPNADNALESLLTEFSSKKKYLRSLMQAIKSNASDIRHHFDSNGTLAKAWLSWSMATGMDDEDPVKMKRYKHYALFSTPFTSTSSTQLSTARLAKKIGKEVIAPLDSVWIIYERTDVLATDRLRYHTYYGKYVSSKNELSYATASTSTANEPLSPSEKQRADRFVKYHNSLKDGLPDLFKLTDRVVDMCIAKLIDIQRHWFRMAVDSMATVFNIKVDDIQDGDGRLEHDPVVDKFRKRQSEMLRHSVVHLGICNQLVDAGKTSVESPQNDEGWNSSRSPASLLSLGSSSSMGSSPDSFDEVDTPSIRSPSSLGVTIDALSPTLSARDMGPRRKSSLLNMTNWKKTLRPSPSKFMSAGGGF
jgi:hypothetical protein